MLPKTDGHKAVVNRSSGMDMWRVKCSCGWVRSGWRWLVEEQFGEHIAWMVDLKREAVVIAHVWDSYVS